MLEFSIFCLCNKAAIFAVYFYVTGITPSWRVHWQCVCCWLQGSCSWSWCDLAVAAVGGAAAVVAAPVAAGALGFTAGGIAAGSMAASAMSVWVTTRFLFNINSVLINSAKGIMLKFCTTVYTLYLEEQVGFQSAPWVVGLYVQFHRFCFRSATYGVGGGVVAVFQSVGAAGLGAGATAAVGAAGAAVAKGAKDFVYDEDWMTFWSLIYF